MRRVGQWHWIALLFGATACDNKHCGTAGAFPRKPPSPFAFPTKMRTGVPVVNETLEGRAGYLKAFTIAVGVFGRYASDRRGSPLRGHRFKELFALRASARQLLSMGSCYREVFLIVRVIAARSRNTDRCRLSISYNLTNEIL